jgi:bacterial/archaeal transporter family-2 protein
MKSAWIYPFIILGGALQTCGAAMNAQLFASLENKWLDKPRVVCADSDGISVYLLQCSRRPCRAPHIFPGCHGGPRWAAWWQQCGSTRALTLVHRVGAGAFVGLTVTSALLTSLAIDHFGWLRVPVHPINTGKMIERLLMLAGVLLITRR